MIQKDPRYRYQSAEEVAIALERYAENAPKPVSVGAISETTYDQPASDSSSISLDEFRDSKSGHGDTLSSRVDDTLSSSGNVLDREVSELTSNQSGRLVSVVPRPDLMDGSFIDLQVESGFKSETPTLSENAHGPSSEVHRGNVDAMRSSGRISSTSGRKRGFDPMLIGALVAALFIIAVALGFMLARVLG
jgi:serine/threonine-protein kinase